MRGIHTHLISRTQSNMTYTSELVPKRGSGGDVYVTVSFSLFNDLRGSFYNQVLVAFA